MEYRAPWDNRVVHRVLLNEGSMQLIPLSSTDKNIPLNMKSYLLLKGNVMIVVSAEQEVSNEHFLPPGNPTPLLISIRDEKLLVGTIPLQEVRSDQRILRSGNTIYIINSDISLEPFHRAPSAQVKPEAVA